MLAVQSGIVALSPMLSFDLSAPSMTALLQEDESVFNMLGCLMPEAQHVEYVPAVQHMLKMKAEEHSLDTMSDRGRPDIDLGPGHHIEKMPQPNPEESPSYNTCKTSCAGQDTCMTAFESADMPGVPSALTQLSALVQQPPASNPASISHSPFASHPWSYNSLSSMDMAHTNRTASLPDDMPALPAPQTLVKRRACSTPQTKASLAAATGQYQLCMQSALHMLDEDKPADPSGGSNSSHVARQIAKRHLDGKAPTPNSDEKIRIKRIQDKNRRNQHRFRARQRARLEDAEEKAKELSQQVSELKRHNAELAACNAQLEGKTSGSLASAKPACAQLNSTPQEPSSPKEDTADYRSLGAFVSKVLGEPFSWEQASRMTFKDIYEAMRMYRAVLTQLLERGAEEAGSAAHAELLQLLALKKESELQRWRCRPQVIHMQYAMLNEADGDSSSPRLAKWHSILAAMQLTPKQTASLLEARTCLLARLMEIIQGRKSIISMLKGSVPSLEDGRRQHVRYLKASAAADSLQRNADAEHALYTDFLLAFWQVATPLQQAKCEMLAFPWMPDVLAMTNLLAACADINVNSEPSPNAYDRGS